MNAQATAHGEAHEILDDRSWEPLTVRGDQDFL